MTEAKLPSSGLRGYMQQLNTLCVNGMSLTDLHKLRGTMTGNVAGIRKNSYYELGQEGDVFENVAEHTAMALLITDVLGEALGLDMRQRGNLNLAAWEHDSGKKTERMWQRAIETADSELISDEAHTLQVVGERKKMALNNVALMEEWENAEAGIPPAANKLMKSIIPATKEGPGENLAGQIMWFTDAILSGSTIVPIGKRFDDLESDPRNGQRNIEFSDSFKDQYNGESLYAVQRRLGTKYEQEFASKLNVEPKELYAWLSNKVQERISTQNMPVLPVSTTKTLSLSRCQPL